MPTAPGHPCAQSGCPRVVPRGVSRCEQHRYQLRAPFANAVRAKDKGIKVGYSTARWRKLRAQFMKAYPLCQCGCGAPSSVLDHIIPAQSSGLDFFAEENLQILSDACHRRKTALEVASRATRAPRDR